MAIRIFTDSGADLTPELAAQHQITVVPLTIHFGDRIYKDGVDITPVEFYRELRNSPEPPNTSQPSPGEFLAAYRANSAPGDVIISFHLSSKLSGTYQSALLASKQLTDRTVHVIDTAMASMGIALAAIYAARWAAAGDSATEVVRRCHELVATTRIYFLVDTLEFLHRHGRIGKAQALVGSLLNIKPVLCVEEGVVTPADKVRGKARAQARVVELALKNTKPGSRYAFAIMDAENEEAAREIEITVRQALPDAELFRAPLGPTVGTHAGPGTVGLIICALP